MVSSLRFTQRKTKIIEGRANVFALFKNTKKIFFFFLKSYN